MSLNVEIHGGFSANCSRLRVFLMALRSFHKGKFSISERGHQRETETKQGYRNGAKPQIFIYLFIFLI